MTKEIVTVTTTKDNAGKGKVQRKKKNLGKRPVHIEKVVKETTIKANKRNNRGKRSFAIRASLGTGGVFNMRAVMDAIRSVEYTPTTAAGRAYVKCRLNPCGEEKLHDLIGIPTGEDDDCVLLRLRDDLILAPFAPALAPLDGRTWDVVIFGTPYLVSQLIMIRFLTGSVPTPDELRGTVNALTSTQWDTVCRYPNWHRPASIVSNAGVSGAYSGTDFQISTLVPTGMSSFNSQQTGAHWDSFRKWRFLSAGFTTHLNAPSVANQGRTIVAHTATESALGNINITQVAADINITPNVRMTVTPPFNDINLALQDTQCYQDITKIGSYAISRGWNETILWNEARDVRPIYRVPASNMSETSFALANTTFLKYDGFDPGKEWIVSYHRGLSQDASLHVKYRSFVELNVPGTSVYAPFMHSATPEDKASLLLVAKLQAELPHTYNAAYNDWNLLAGLIKTCTQRIINPFLRGALTTSTKFIHNLVDSGSKKIHDKLRQYDAYDGEGTYG